MTRHRCDLRDRISSLGKHRDCSPAKIMKMQVSNSSLNRRRLPFRSKISFFECKSRFRGQNQWRIAGYLTQHSVQRRRTADRYRCCPDTSSRRLFLTEGDRLAVIGRPWQPQNVSLALTCMESDNQCPLHFNWRNLHKCRNMFGEPDLFGPISMMKPFESSHVIKR